MRRSIIPYYFHHTSQTRRSFHKSFKLIPLLERDTLRNAKGRRQFMTCFSITSFEQFVFNSRRIVNFVCMRTRCTVFIRIGCADRLRQCKCECCVRMQANMCIGHLEINDTFFRQNRSLIIKHYTLRNKPTDISNDALYYWSRFVSPYF